MTQQQKKKVLANILSQHSCKNPQGNLAEPIQHSVKTINDYNEILSMQAWFNKYNSVNMTRLSTE
jgi:hypothetical protein